MGCCTGIIKYLLFLFNVLFWLAGGAVLGAGIYLLVEPNVENVVDVAGLQFYYPGCYVLISVGCIMFVVGFFGCCGAIKENRCLLGTYFVFLLIIFLMQVGVGIWALVSQSSGVRVNASRLNRNRHCAICRNGFNMPCNCGLYYYRTTGYIWIEATIQSGLSSTLPIDESKDAAYANTVVSIQQSFQCCGLINGCSDWVNGTTKGCQCTPPTTGISLTCAAPNGTCTADTATVYQNDCYDAIVKFINDNIVIIAGIGLGIGLAEIFGMIFAVVMYRNGKHSYETY